MAIATPSQPATDLTTDYYAVLDIAPHASPADIERAYQHQSTLYDPTHGASMNDDFAMEAQERRAAIAAAYAVLSDPQQRFAYDQARGLVGTEATDRRGVSNREVIWTIGGVLLGLLLLSLVYNLAPRSNATALNRFTEVNQPAEPIDLRSLDGGRFNLADQRGKVVIVNFWGTWCEPCKQETPALQAAYTKLRDQGLVIVGVNLFEAERLSYNNDETDVQTFAERYGVTYPIALDETGSVTTAYKLYPIPVSYVIDQQGNVRYIRIGEMTSADVEQVFQQLKET